MLAPVVPELSENSLRSTSLFDFFKPLKRGCQFIMHPVQVALCNCFFNASCLVDCVKELQLKKRNGHDWSSAPQETQNPIKILLDFMYL